MRGTNLDAAVHFISWKKSEPYYSWDIFMPPKDSVYSKRRTVNKNDPSIKVTAKVGARVFSTFDERTAVIIGYADRRIMLQFDDNNSISTYSLKFWLVNKPFLPIGD